MGVVALSGDLVRVRAEWSWPADRGHGGPLLLRGSYPGVIIGPCPGADMPRDSGRGIAASAGEGLGVAVARVGRDGCQLVADSFARDLKVVLRLQVEPELGGGVEVARQAQGVVGGDGPLAARQ